MNKMWMFFQQAAYVLLIGITSNVVTFFSPTYRHMYVFRFSDNQN